MKNVKVLEIPVRYKGATHAPGSSFEMEDEHVNESIVEVMGNVAPKSIDEMTVPELKKYAAENDIDLGEAKKRDDVLMAIQDFESKDPEE